MSKIIGVITVAVSLLNLAKAEDIRAFPKDFMFGTGTSAYQTEGAWDQEAKSENIWDRWIHTDPSRIKNNDTADEADNYYTDIAVAFSNARDLNVQHFRFSIPWSRILPNGSADNINLQAISHYQLFITSLTKYNITPMVTLYYHDLPQSLQDIGGWTNPKIVDYYVDYARVCFQYFTGVDYWITFNDPAATCRKGYGDGTFAPGIKSDGVDEYKCAYNVIKAHAATYRMYKEEFKELSGMGKISIALDMKWSIAASTSSNDSAAVERRNSFEFGLYADPIYKGHWPSAVIDRIALRSKGENLSESRLPVFTTEEISYINGTSDFMAINMYHTHLVEDTEEADFGDPGYVNDMKAKVYLDPSWTLAENGQVIRPDSAKDTLIWLSKNYNYPDIFITENGVPDNNTEYDITRIVYYRDYLTAILDTMFETDVKVIGYTAWSMADCFEWTDGYSYKFGFYRRFIPPHYDGRLPKDSGIFYSELIQSRTIPEVKTTTSTTSTYPTSIQTTTDLPETTTASATKAAFSLIALVTSIFVSNISLKT